MAWKNRDNIIQSGFLYREMHTSNHVNTTFLLSVYISHLQKKKNNVFLLRWVSFLLVTFSVLVLLLAKN